MSGTIPSLSGADKTQEVKKLSAGERQAKCNVLDQKVLGFFLGLSLLVFVVGGVSALPQLQCMHCMTPALLATGLLGTVLTSVTLARLRREREELPKLDQPKAPPSA